MLIESQWGIALPDGASMAAGSHEITRLGLPSSDMSGDGLGDVISYEISQPKDIFSTDYRYRVAALRGTDGSELWEREFTARPDPIPLSLPDLSGDGLGEVLVLTFDKERVQAGTCGSMACVLAEHQTHTWTMQVLSGLDGSSLWSWQLEGSKGGVGASQSNIVPSVLTSHWARATTAAAVLPILSGDHDGDGLPDLVVNSFDEIQTGHMESVPEIQTGTRVFANDNVLLVGTKAQVLSGDSGAVLFERLQDPVPGGATLIPAGDAVGSGTTDLLWQLEREQNSPRVLIRTPVGDRWIREASTTLDAQLIDGETLDAAWSVTLDPARMDWGFVEAPGTDLTGDGHDDLLFFWRYVVQDDTDAWSMSVLSGSNGSEAWGRPLLSYPYELHRVPIGPAGGGPGNDLLFVDLVLRQETQEFEVVMKRVDGATGQDLLVTQRITAANEGFNVSMAGDADGDGVGDLAIARITQLPNQQPGQREYRSTVWIESGDTGTEIASFTVDGEALPIAAADLDGDGRSDSVVGWIEAGMQMVKLAAVSSTDGLLWEATTDPSSFDVRTAPGGSLILSRTLHTSSDHRSRIDLIDGKDGSLYWGRGDPLGLDQA